MTSAHASEVKRAGHKREAVFAQIIGGEVIKGTGKADVSLDFETWSVKGGTWSQIFLYRGARAATLGPEFRECVDVFPDDRSDYVVDKDSYKVILAKKMRVIAGLLSNDAHLKTFLYRAMFSDSVDYLVIEKGRKFLEFNAEDVVEALVSGMEVRNSRGEQKVVFYVEGVRAQLGQLEMRNDSIQHYKEIKCRFNLPILCKFLEARCAVNEYLV